MKTNQEIIDQIITEKQKIFNAVDTFKDAAKNIYQLGVGLERTDEDQKILDGIAYELTVKLTEHHKFLEEGLF